MPPILLRRVRAARARSLGIRSGVIPSGDGITSRSAPNASMVRSFSTEKASEVTMCNGCPVRAQTSASELPVLPPVYSTTA